MKNKKKNTKNRKRKVIIGLVILAVVAAGIIFFVWNAGKKEEVVEKGHFIEKQEEKIEYADIATAQKGDTVSFGDYNGAIDWTVLAADNDKLLLLTSKCIEKRAYHTEETEITWEQCEMRKWLNQTFYEMAFSEKEKAQIQKTKVVNKDNDAFETRGGKTTKDYVFLLSIEEAETYFSETGERMTSFTDGNGGWWWLRSPGFQETDAANIGDYGNVNKAGHKVYDKYVVNGGVRPAIWITRK